MGTSRFSSWLRCPLRCSSALFASWSPARTTCNLPPSKGQHTPRISARDDLMPLFRPARMSPEQLPGCCQPCCHSLLAGSEFTHLVDIDMFYDQHTCFCDHSGAPTAAVLAVLRCRRLPAHRSATDRGRTVERRLTTSCSRSAAAHLLRDQEPQELLGGKHSLGARNLEALRCAPHRLGH